MQLQACSHPGRPLLGSWKSSFMGFLSATASMNPPISIGLRAKDCAEHRACHWPVKYRALSFINQCRHVRATHGVV